MENAAILTVVNFAQQLFDDSDEEENVLEKVDQFAERTVPMMNDHQFKIHFRLMPRTFENLLSKMRTVANLYNININGNNERTPLEKEIMVMMWYVGNMESLRSVADRFGISKSTCWDILNRTCLLLGKVNQHYNIIKWPNQQEQANISQHLNLHGFDGIIGCIDGSHIKIIAPRENSNSYVNRKGFHSILLQGVCDHKMCFTDVYCGEVGSMHDYSLYKRSPLYAGIQRGQVRFYNDSHMIGDLAYKLEENLIVGFKNNGHLTQRQNNFNKILNKIRVKIENAFALLKGRFRKLKFIETSRMDIIVLLVFSACILHNICILNDDLVEDLVDVNAERNEEGDNNPDIQDVDEAQLLVNAIVKRDLFVNNLPLINN